MPASMSGVRPKLSRPRSPVEWSKETLAIIAQRASLLVSLCIILQHLSHLYWSNLNCRKPPNPLSCQQSIFMLSSCRRTWRLQAVWKEQKGALDSDWSSESSGECFRKCKLSSWGCSGSPMPTLPTRKLPNIHWESTNIWYYMIIRDNQIRNTLI